MLNADYTKIVNKKCPIQNKEVEFIFAEEYGSEFLICKECGYMITLKETEDYINQQNKMKQLREQEDLKNSSKPTITCPYCQSTNTKPISGTERAVSILGLGIFSKKINKSCKCLDCKCTW